MGFYDGSESFDVPALHISSFYDLSVDDTAFAFNYFETGRFHSISGQPVLDLLPRALRLDRSHGSHCSG